MTGINYKDAKPSINGHKISYRQYKTMQADYQRSRFYGEEYGGILTKDGRVIRAPSAYKSEYDVIFSSEWTGAVASDEVLTHYHTHWDSINSFAGYDSAGKPQFTAFGPSDADRLFIQQNELFAKEGILIDRLNIYYYNSKVDTYICRNYILGFFPFLFPYFQ